MDLNAILSVASRMFPSADLNGAVQKAQTALQGAPDTLEGVAQVAKNVGLDAALVNNIYQKYGNTMQAKAICRMLGTTPEAIKADADHILGSQPASGQSFGQAKKSSAPGGTKKFPRLK